MEADYLAYGLVNFILPLSPQRVILGGGVMEQPQLFPLVRQKTLDYLNGYVQSPTILEEIDSYSLWRALPPPENKAGLVVADDWAERLAGGRLDEPLIRPDAGGDKNL